MDIAWLEFMNYRLWFMNYKRIYTSRIEEIHGKLPPTYLFPVLNAHVIL